MYFITVDPGWNTAITLYKHKVPQQLLLIKLMPNEKKERTTEKVRMLGETFESTLFRLHQQYSTDVFNLQIRIEGVGLWGDNMRSLTAAKRGDLFNLSYLVGAYVKSSYSFTNDVDLLDVRKWKGQIPNNVLAKRVNLFLFQNNLGTHRLRKNEHIHSAVGMAMSEFGIL